MAQEHSDSLIGRRIYWNTISGKCFGYIESKAKENYYFASICSKNNKEVVLIHKNSIIFDEI